MRNPKEWEILYTEWHRYPHPEWKEKEGKSKGKSELELLKKENEELRKELELAELRAENERLKRQIFEIKYKPDYWNLTYGNITLC